MGFHWGDGPSQINQVVAVTGSGSAPITASLIAAAKVAKKPSKAPIKAKPSKTKGQSSAERVVGFELIFTNSITGAQLTVRLPSAGAFHDPKRKTALSHAEDVGEQIAKALNKALHDPAVSARPKK